MKQLLIVPALAVLACGVAAAEHRGLAAADTDGDGQVSLAEFEAAHAARVRERFARMDDNADGLLSADEVEQHARGRHHGPRRHRHHDPERLVERLDTDGSGSVSFAEMEGRRFAPSAETFTAADADGSGELDGAELQSLIEQHRERRKQERAAQE